MSRSRRTIVATLAAMSGCLGFDPLGGNDTPRPTPEPTNAGDSTNATDSTADTTNATDSTADTTNATTTRATTSPTPTDSPTPTASPTATPRADVAARVKYDDRWKATLTVTGDGETTSETLRDETTRRIDVADDAKRVELYAEKIDGDPTTLVAQILVEETVVAEGRIEDTYGSVTIDRDFF